MNLKQLQDMVQGWVAALLAKAGVITLPRGVMLKLKQVESPVPLNGPGTVAQMVGGLPLELPLTGLVLDISYRATVTTAATSVNADAPYSIINNLRISGKSKIPGVGQRNVKNISLPRMQYYNQVVHGHLQRVFGALSTAVGTYDMRVVCFIPLALWQLVRDIEFLASCINGPQWNELNLYLTQGSFADLFEGGAGTISAYGQSGGNPSVNVTLIQAAAGPSLTKFDPFYVEQNEIVIQGPSGTFTDQQIYPKLPIGEGYYDLALHTYVQGTNQITAQSELDGTALTRLIMKESAIPRVMASWEALRYKQVQCDRGVVATQNPAGYIVQDWGNGWVEAAFQTRDFNANNLTWDLYGDWTPTAGAAIAIVPTLIREAVIS